MIAAAEQIVAERGLASMTLSAVQSAAGQSNKSAASYHFGDRDGLIAAVAEARMVPINAHRRRLLHAADERAEPPTLKLVATALVTPLVAGTLGQPQSYWARFLAQVLMDPRQADRMRDYVQSDSLRETERRYRDICDLPADLGSHRYGAMVGLTVVTLATWEARPRDAVPEHFLPDLVDMCVAVLSAPRSPLPSTRK